ncbi:MAG: hypothetical protein ACR2FY_26040 [Pirellulaceae bacterium]
MEYRSLSDEHDGTLFSRTNDYDAYPIVAARRASCGFDRRDDDCAGSRTLAAPHFALRRGNTASARSACFSTGLEWQLNPQMEFTAMYTDTDRTNTTAFSDVGVMSYRQFEGQLLRLQFQVNY